MGTEIYRRVIETEEQLERVVKYIQQNRMKHNLPENDKLQRIIDKMITPFDKLID